MKNNKGQMAVVLAVSGLINIKYGKDLLFRSLPSGMDGILKKHFDKFRDKGELPPELRNNEPKNFPRSNQRIL